MHRLVDAGHSVVVVEHNTEVALASDWILDLGPEAGDEGGRVVGEGPPEAMARLDTPTGTRAGRGALAPVVGEVAGAALLRPRRERSERAPRPAQARARLGATAERHPHRRRARAQPAAGHGGHPARQAGGGHRRLRLRQVHPRLRRALRRGPAALPRLPLDLRAPVHPAARPARGRPPRGRAAHGRPRAEALARHAALDRRHRERGLPPPAPPLVAPRHRPLPEVRPARPGGRRGRPRRARRRGLPGRRPDRPRARSCAGARASTSTRSPRWRRRASPRSGSTAPLHDAAQPPACRPLPDPRRGGGGRDASGRRDGGRERPPRAGHRPRARAGRRDAAGPGTRRAPSASTRPAAPARAAARASPPPTRASSRGARSTAPVPSATGFGAPRVEEDGETRRRGRRALPRLRRHAPAARGAGGPDRRPAHRRRRGPHRGRGPRVARRRSRASCPRRCASASGRS